MRAAPFPTGEQPPQEATFLYPPEAVTFVSKIEMSETDHMSAWRSEAVERLEGSAINGLGLFAVKDIPANMLVAIKQGHVVPGAIASAYTRIIKGAQQQIGPDEFLTGLTPYQVDRNLVGYNHSCEPNARVVVRKGVSLAYLVTRESIEATPDDPIELTVDYGVSEMGPHAHHLDPCECGTDSCRHIVDPEQDWQDPVLQQKYAGEFPWFIQEAIDAQRVAER